MTGQIHVSCLSFFGTSDRCHIDDVNVNINPTHTEHHQNQGVSRNHNGNKRTFTVLLASVNNTSSSKSKLVNDLCYSSVRKNPIIAAGKLLNLSSANSLEKPIIKKLWIRFAIARFHL